MKIFYKIMLLTIISNPLLAQTIKDNPDNGTIIRIEQTDSLKKVFRVHEQRIQIGDLSDPENRIIYNEPILESKYEIATIQLGEYINIDEILTIIDTVNSSQKTWLHISKDHSIEGWIYLHNGDPYSSNNWQIIEEIVIAGRSWTVRKLEDSSSTFELLEIRNNPGLADTTVLFELSVEENRGQINFDIIAVTEEVDTIGDRTDHWIKIVFEQDYIGWVFGGYSFPPRGGPRYSTPSANIAFSIGYY